MPSPKETIVRIAEEGYTWWVRNHDQERLLKEFIPLLSQVRPLSDTQILKKTDTRLIFKENFIQRQEPLIIKVFKRPRFKDKVKYCFRSSQSNKEFRVSLELHQRAIPTFQVVASGASRRFGFLRGDILISREITGAIPLSSWAKENLVKESIPFLERKAFIQSLASFMRKVHDGGVYSNDFHQGNILVWLKKWEDPHFYLTDLHSIRIKHTVPLKERIKNLAQLNDFQISIKDRVRFLKSYLQGGDPLGLSMQEMVHRIASVSLTQWQHLWKKRKRKCLRPGKELSVLQKSPWKGMIRKEYHTNDFLQLLENLGTEFSKTSTKKIKEGSQISVKEIVYPAQERSGALITKYYKPAKLLSKWKGLFRFSRAKRAWINAHNLLMRGVATPLPVAFGEKKQWGITQESFFVTEKIPQAKASDSFFKDLPENHPHPQTFSLKRIFLGKLARMVQWMHRSGISHGDLKASNILVTMKRRNPSIVFVDVDGVKIKNKLGVKDITKDLSRMSAAFSEFLASSEQDCLLALYRKGNPFFLAHEREIRARARKLTSKKIKQKQGNQG